jgi:hypothetical protein
MRGGSELKIEKNQCRRRPFQAQWASFIHPGNPNANVYIYRFTPPVLRRTAAPVVCMHCVPKLDEKNKTSFMLSAHLSILRRWVRKCVKLINEIKERIVSK